MLANICEAEPIIYRSVAAMHETGPGKLSFLCDQITLLALNVALSRLPEKSTITQDGQPTAGRKNMLRAAQVGEPMEEQVLDLLTMRAATTTRFSPMLKELILVGRKYCNSLKDSTSATMEKTGNLTSEATSPAN